MVSSDMRQALSEKQKQHPSLTPYPLQLTPCQLFLIIFLQRMNRYFPVFLRFNALYRGPGRGKRREYWDIINNHASSYVVTVGPADLAGRRINNKADLFVFNYVHYIRPALGNFIYNSDGKLVLGKEFRGMRRGHYLKTQVQQFFYHRERLRLIDGTKADKNRAAARKHRTGRYFGFGKSPAEIGIYTHNLAGTLHFRS